MSRSARFARHLLVAALAVALDYLIGRLTNTLSLGIACWAVLVLIASAVMDYLNDTPGTTRNPSGAACVLDDTRLRTAPVACQEIIQGTSRRAAPPPTRPSNTILHTPHGQEGRSRI